MAQDAYYSRTEVSNSDLTALKNMLHPDVSGIDPTNAFRLGTLVDALVTEPAEANHVRKTVGDYQYSDDEWTWGLGMRAAFNRAAEQIPFLGMVRKDAETQRVMANHGQEFEYNGFSFELDTRCKWDFWMEDLNFGGDLKTTSAETQDQFEEAIDRFDWDRSRAWYMDIAGSDQDFIVAISKKNQRIFTKAIRRSDMIYNRGKEKYLELAFKYWTLKI